MARGLQLFAAAARRRLATEEAQRDPKREANRLVCGENLRGAVPVAWRG
jgi:hypothetical protein